MTGVAEGEVIIELRGIRKSFGGIEVLHGVDFKLRRGEIHAFLGANGAGKSTLMKLINGVYQLEEGEILIDGKPVKFRSPADARAFGIGMVYQEFSLIPTLTVGQNVLLTEEPTRFGVIGRRSENERARAALAKLGIDIAPGARLSRLSVGDQQMVEIAKTLVHNPRILILDEPTASLSREEVGRLFSVLRSLREQGIGIIYISHHLHEVLDICDQLTILKDGVVTKSTSKAGVSIDELVTAVVGKPLQARAERNAGALSKGAPLLEVDSLHVGSRVRGVSFTIHKGEVVGFAGLVGSGRSEILEALFGARKYRGTIRWNGKTLQARSPAEAMRAGIALIPEDRRREGLVAQQSVRDNMLLAAWSRVTRMGLISDRGADAVVSDFVKRLEIRLASAERPVVTLSGGNQQKVVLAKFLAIQPQLLMFDEPTAGIDVGTKRQILNQIRSLAAEGYAGIFVSSDLQEIAEVADRIIVLQRGVVTAEIDCALHRPTETDLTAAIQAKAA